MIYPPPLINSAKAATASSSERPAGLGGGFLIYFSISSAIAIGFCPADIIYEKASMSSVAAVPISSEPTTFTYLNSYSTAFTKLSFLKLQNSNPNVKYKYFFEINYFLFSF